MITFVIGNNIVLSDLPNQALPLPPVGCSPTNSTTVPLANAWNSATLAKGDAEYENDWKDEEYSTLIQIMSMSYMWYSTLSCCLSVLLGLVCSVIHNQFSNEKRKLINSKCISPPILWLWRKLFPTQMLNWVLQEEKDTSNDHCKGSQTNQSL